MLRAAPALRALTLTSTLAILAATPPALAASPTREPATVERFDSSGRPAFLTPRSSAPAREVALDFVDANLDALGVTAADLAGMEVREYASPRSAVRQVELLQKIEGIKVYGGSIIVSMNRAGQVINAHSLFVGKAAPRANATKPSLDAVAAVERAAAVLDIVPQARPAVTRAIGGAAQAVLLEPAGISVNPIPANLVYQLTADGALRLAWEVVIAQRDTYDWWNLRIDAATGEELARDNYTVHEDFREQFRLSHGDDALAKLEASAKARAGADNYVLANGYRVYGWPIESPNYATPAPPADGRTLENNPSGDASANASPFGWHATGSTNWTDTQGNNVDAHKGATRSSCGATLDCDHPIDLTQDPTVAMNVTAALDNLFYWNNVIHDVWYDYGFDEVSRNFQQDNNGMGGAGNDRVNANCQASGNCNANFGTPADGSAPTMNMFTCNIATPSRDGDLDNGVIIHEYTHGISNRLTGGASVSCLTNSEQGGEGWSDWYGLMMTIEPGDQGTDSRGIGTWLLGQGPGGVGVRTVPYSTNFAINAHTYDDIKTAVVPHGVGEVWASILWEVTWELIGNGVSQSGLDPDIYNGTGGNNLAMQLVTDGMKLQPCGPGFVDARDAIMQADLNLTGGVNQCTMWRAFARRGLGFSAIQGSSSNNNDGTEAFDIPPTCDFLNPTNPTVDVCVGSNAQFNIDVNGGYSPPVTMSVVSGLPPGTSGSFSPNPVPGPLPTTTVFTVSSIGAAAVGTHVITVAGNDGATNATTTVTLNVYSTTLTTPTLVTPTNGATGVSPAPVLTWSAVTGVQDYLVEIDDDPGFGSIDYSAAETTTSHQVTTFLAGNTTYSWRVTPRNPCVTGSASAVFTFTTANITCTVYNATGLPLPIPSSGTSGSMTSTIAVPDSGSILDVNVTLTGTHTWMGDLNFHLASPATTDVLIMNTGPCGNVDNFDLTLDDAAASAFPCPPTGGGTYLPTAPLSGFDTEDVNGTWTLTINDTAGGDSGFLNAWSMEVCYGGGSCPAITLAPATLPGGTTGVAYSQTITASGGTGPYTYAVTSGTPPTGVTLASGGLLSGTPTAAGTFNFTVTATDSGGCTGSRGYSIVIACPTITVAPATLPGGTVGAAYSQTITASGGNGPYTFAVSGGTLPTGLTLASGGLLSGTPTAGGTFNFTVEATDQNGCTGSQLYSVVISCPTITLAPATLPGGTVGTAYSQTITASGGTGPYTFAVSGGTLPTGLTLASGGLLSGTPSAAGTFNFTVEATDANGCTGSLLYSVVISCPTITLAPATLPNGTVGSAYSQSITASGGTGPYTFAVTTGTLPAGLTLSSAGLLSGTPTAAGTSNFTVEATDANGCAGSLAYSLTIDCPTVTLAPATLPNGIVGTAYSQMITASGGTGPYTFAVTTGTLPAGLTLSSAGLLSGTPTAAGTSNFTVEATDANGCTGSLAYSLVIDPAGCPTITLAPATLPNGVVGNVYSQTITASGGTAPYTYAVTAGTLPAGLTLSAAGVLSGTPTAAGTSNFTVTATDAGACTGSLAYALTIDASGCPTITLTPGTLPDGTEGIAYSVTFTASGGTAPYTFSATTLPAGLTLDSATGVLSGTPTTAGAYAFDVTATDLNGCQGLRRIVPANQQEERDDAGQVVAPVSTHPVPTSADVSQSYGMNVAPAVDYVVGEGLGAPNTNRVRVYTRDAAATAVDFQAYGAGQWGTNVASGDINGAIYGEILTGPGPGSVYGPHLRAFDRTGTAINKVNFFAYNTLRFGVNPGAAALDGDAFHEILTGPGPGDVFGPHVRGWNFDNAALTAIAKVNFFAYGTLKFGVNVEDGDVDGDAFGEILTGPGPGAIFGPTVRGFNYDGTTLTSMAKINFNAYAPLQYGVNVAGGDVDDDGMAEIATAPGPGPTSQFPSAFSGFNFDAATITALPGYNVTTFTSTLFGGRVGLGDLSANGNWDLIAGAGRDAAADSTVEGYGYDGTALTALPGPFLPFSTSTYGVNVSAGALGHF